MELRDLSLVIGLGLSSLALAQSPQDLASELVKMSQDSLYSSRIMNQHNGIDSSGIYTFNFFEEKISKFPSLGKRSNERVTYASKGTPESISFVDANNNGVYDGADQLITWVLSGRKDAYNGSSLIMPSINYADSARNDSTLWKLNNKEIGKIYSKLQEQKHNIKLRSEKP